MGSFRVLVTGPRGWTAVEPVHRRLDLLLAIYGVLTVVHGACPTGFDKICHNWALNAYHASSYGAVIPEPHPAIWRVNGVFDRAAGFTRNAEMVALGAGLCLAGDMPCTDAKCRRQDPHRTHGTSHCADLADKAGIPVEWITP